MLIDGGTIEHVFHLPNSLHNIFSLLKAGGRVIHFSPSSNHVDHGFYMFSPTLFWDYYQANGFEFSSFKFFEHNRWGSVQRQMAAHYEPRCVRFISGGLSCGQYGIAFTATNTEQSTSGVIPQMRRSTKPHEANMVKIPNLAAGQSKGEGHVHYRDGSYPLKGKVPIRNGNPKSYCQMIDHIIDNLDCQGVQLGHPEMTSFPPRPGLVDLSRVKDSFLLQAFAGSRARFMIGGASGSPTLDWSFDLPTAIADCPDTHAGWANAEQFVLTPAVATSDGQDLQNQALYDAGLLDFRLLTKKNASGEKYKIRKNSGAELSALATHPHGTSGELKAWREPAECAPRPRPNTVTWPPQVSYKMNFFDPN